MKSAADQKTKKTSDKDEVQFSMECKDFMSFMSKLVKKIMEKSPVKLLLARNMSSLDPQEMGTAAKESNAQKIKAALKMMNEANRVADNEVDELLQQYIQYIDGAVVPQASEYNNLSVSTVRVDILLLFETVANEPSLGKLWSCVKASLLLSHGQATVERQIDNHLSEATFVAKRLICDHMTAVLGYRTSIPATSNCCWQLHQPDLGYLA